METSQKQNSPAFIMRKRNILSLTLLSVLFLIDITGCSLFKNLFSADRISSEAAKAVAKAKEQCAWFNRSPLFCTESAEVVHALIKEGVNVNINDDNFKTPLYHFVKKGNLEVVKELLANGADVNRESPIYLAEENGDHEIVKALIDAGADVNTLDKNGQTLIYLAVKKGDHEIVKALIDAGADVNTLDKEGRTALSIALDKGHTEVAKLLRPSSYPDTDDATSIKNFYEQLDICTNGAVIQPPTREQVENQVLNEMLEEREGADRQSIIRTKEYADRVEKTIAKASNRRTKGHPQNNCVKSLIEYYNDSQQLAIIYDYCVSSHKDIFYNNIGVRFDDDGRGQSVTSLFNAIENEKEEPWTLKRIAHNKMKFSKRTPEEILKSSCIEKSRIYQDNYVDSKAYFLNRLQKDQDKAQVYSAAQN